MKCIRMGLLVVGLVFSSCPLSVYGVQNEEEPKFDQMSELLQAHFALELDKDSGRLDLKLPETREDAQGIYTQLARTLTYGGGGGGGADSWQYSAGNARYSDAYFAIHHFQGGETRDFVRYQENVRPYRIVEIEGGEDGRFSFLYINPVANEMAYLRQNNEGVQLVLQQGGTCRAVLRDSFKQLVSDSGQLVSDFGAVLKKYGLKNRYPDFYPELLNEISRTMGPPKKTPAEFRKLLADLASKKFKIREQASDDVVQRFDEFEPFIMKHAVDDAVPPEVRSRLQKTLNEKLTATRAVARSLIAEPSTLKDPSLLLESWAVAREKKLDLDKEFVGRLQAVTGKNWDQFDAWKKELQVVKSKVEFTQPVKLKSSAFEDFREDATKLLTAETDEKGRVRLDKLAWAAEFGNRSPSQLYDEMAKLLKERNLPKSWLTNKNTVAAQGHEKLLFEKLKEACINDSAKSRNRGGYYSRSDNEFVGKRMKGYFNTEIPSRNRRGFALGKRPVRFDFALMELDPNGVRVSCVQDNSNFHFLAVSRSTNHFVIVSSDRKQVAITEVRGEQTKMAIGASIKELQQREPGYFNGCLIPTLQTYGLKLTPPK